MHLDRGVRPPAAPGPATGERDDAGCANHACRMADRHMPGRTARRVRPPPGRRSHSPSGARLAELASVSPALVSRTVRGRPSKKG